jgi:ssDNA-binding replication factor A large subunit
MAVIKAIVKDGRLEFDVPLDWPDGTEVIVRPACDEETFGIREEDWPKTSEAVAEWLKWFDSLEPLVFTDEERAAWATARKDQKEFEKATFTQRAEKLRRVWE